MNGLTDTANDWHTEMAGLTPYALVLAANAGCPRQVVAYGPLACGLHLHLELTAGLITEMLVHVEQQLRALGGPTCIHPVTLEQLDWSPVHNRLAPFWDRLTAKIEREAR